MHNFEGSFKNSSGRPWPPCPPDRVASDCVRPGLSLRLSPSYHLILLRRGNTDYYIISFPSPRWVVAMINVCHYLYHNIHYYIYIVLVRQAY